MTRELPIIACSLDAVGQAARAGEFAALLADARDVERTELGARFSIPAVRAAEVRALLDKEQACCPFWEFSITQVQDSIVVDARAPLAAAPLVDRLLGTAG